MTLHLRHCLFLALLGLPFSGFAKAPPKATIVTSHPLATEAGARVLEAGGSAADAAVAASLVLAVVEPERGGLGGGGLALYFDAAQNEWAEFEYLPSVPPADPTYIPLSLTAAPATPAAEAVGVPGLIAGLGKLQARFGRLVWRDLFVDAQKLAREGFVPAPKAPLRIQTQLAGTLTKIATNGASSFYEGNLARAIHRETEDQGVRLPLMTWQSYTARVGVPRLLLYKDLRVAVPSLPSGGGDLFDQLLRSQRVQDVLPQDAGFADFLDKEVRSFLAEHAGWDKAGTRESSVAVVIVDADGNAVSLLHTLFAPGEKALVLPKSGLVLNAAGVVPSLQEVSSVTGALQERPLTTLTPLIIRRGFVEMLALAPQGDWSAGQVAFEVLFRLYGEDKSLAKALKAPRLIVIPQAENIYEAGGITAKALTSLKSAWKTVATTDVRVQAIHVTDKNRQPYADPRGGGFAQVVTLQEIKKKK